MEKIVTCLHDITVKFIKLSNDLDGLSIQFITDKISKDLDRQCCVILFRSQIQVDALITFVTSGA